MPVSVVINATEQAGENSTKLRELLKPLAAKVRGVDIERIRRGKRSAPVSRSVEASLGPDEKPDAFVNELVEEILTLCADEADGNKTRFKVVVLGEGKTLARPVLADCTIEIEEEVQERSSRESEMVGILSEAKLMLKDAREGYCQLVRVLPPAMTSATELSRELGTALAGAQGSRWEWEYKTEELAANKVLEGLRIQSEERKTDRRWTTIDAFFSRLEPYLDLAAQIYMQSGTNPAPTEAEIDQVFGAADPEFARLAKAFVAAKGGEATNIGVELKKRWQAMPDSAKAVVLGAVSKMEQARVVTLGLWMKRNGLT
jgi:hypothetical protein